MNGSRFDRPKRCRGIQSTPAPLAFKRRGDPKMGTFEDATILKSFGDAPKNLDEL